MRSAPGVLLGLVALLDAGALSAQGVQDPETAEAARIELARLRNELLHSRDEVDRLMHLRLRHDLGLPVAEVSVPVVSAARPATSSALEEARIELLREERITADLARRYDRLEKQVEGLRARAGEEDPEPVPDWVAVPRPYTLPPGDPDAGAGDPGPEGSPPAAPAGESRAPETDDDGQRPTGSGEPARLLDLDPIRGQIQGSRDPGRVARALYRAAMDLIATGERLRATGRSPRAEEYDVLARERLERALEVLAPALRVAPDGELPAYIDLFYQGKCREALFRIDERRGELSLRDAPVEFQRREQAVRDPFLAITVSDVKVENGAEVLGRWGQAAQAALDHFRWMNLNGNFTPSVDPKSITWEER